MTIPLTDGQLGSVSCERKASRYEMILYDQC